MGTASSDRVIKASPAVRKFMSTSPITVSPTTQRAEALALMRSKKIHHMPVTEAGKVVGLVSDSDLYELEVSAPHKTLLRDCMRSRPFIISPEQPVDEVVKAMTTQKQSLAAVVVDRDRVVGMFTATDGLRAFADYLQRNAR